MGECAFWFKSEGIERLNFPPKGPRTQNLRYGKSDYCLSEMNRNYQSCYVEYTVE